MNEHTPNRDQRGQSALRHGFWNRAQRHECFLPFGVLRGQLLDAKRMFCGEVRFFARI